MINMSNDAEVPAEEAAAHSTQLLRTLASQGGGGTTLEGQVQRGRGGYQRRMYAAPAQGANAGCGVWGGTAP
jgi:hypothetical protein